MGAEGPVEGEDSEMERGRREVPVALVLLLFGQGRGQPCEGEEDQNLIRMGGGGSG